jgi:fatty-acyl-CoA synthase
MADHEWTLTARSALHARQRPDHVAVICEQRQVTYADLHRESNRTAHTLLAQGLRRGARVGFLGRESEFYLDVGFGCAKSRTVLVPINWRLTPDEVEHILNDSGAEMLFVEREFRPLAERLLPRLPNLRLVVTVDTDNHPGGGVLIWKDGSPDTDLDLGADPEDPVAQLYTSGTTGLPKGVVLANRTFFAFITASVDAGVDWVDWRPEDRGLTCFTCLHTAGYVWFMHAFHVGSTTVIMRTFVADEAARIIERHAITTLWAAPAMLRMLLTERGVTPRTFRSLRKVVYSGSPIDSELLSTCMEKLGCEMAQGYSSAEAGGFLTCLPPEDHIPQSAVLGSAGRVWPGIDLKIIDDAGRERPVGEAGRVTVRSPARFIEYWNQPEATAEALVDGWLYMGDMGYVDENGYLFLLDRVNDTINVAGQNIYPVEVENALQLHPAVAEVAVYGVPDPHWGEAIRSAVVLEPGRTATPRDFMTFLRGRIANFKIPTGYHIVESLPRNPTGKVLRRVLRDQQTADPTGTR